MKIYDLINQQDKCSIIADKCHLCILKTMEEEYFPLRNFMYHRYLHTRWKSEMEELLNEVPVFLVTTKMAGNFVECKENDIMIKVPAPGPGNHKKGKKEDNPLGPLQEWVKDIEQLLKSDLSAPVCSQNTPPNNNTTTQPDTGELGVCIYNSSWSIMPIRIFVWIDNIENENISIQQLLPLVIIHEYAHALMNVCLYKAEASQYFSKKNRGDSYIEEALANAFALRAMKEYSDTDINNIVEYVKNQKSGYNRGADIYSNPYLFEIINEWMKIKVLIDNKAYDTLKDFAFTDENGKPDFNKLLDNTTDGISMFYPMGNHFRERYYGNVSFDSHTLIKTNEDGGIWFSDDYEKKRDNRKWGYINSRGQMTIKPKCTDISFEFGKTTYTDENGSKQTKDLSL